VERLFLLAAALLGGAAVGLGAFGRAPPAPWPHRRAAAGQPAGQASATWSIICLALFVVVLALGRVASQQPAGLERLALCGAGLLLFSGSLIGMAFTGQRWLGAITPIRRVLPGLSAGGRLAAAVAQLEHSSCSSPTNPTFGPPWPRAPTEDRTMRSDGQRGSGLQPAARFCGEPSPSIFGCWQPSGDRHSGPPGHLVSGLFGLPAHYPPRSMAVAEACPCTPPRTLSSYATAGVVLAVNCTPTSGRSTPVL
jgi:uncharacterized membrane protein YgdD (TMEM256/DUF423 family)